jgi:hypothetical protein
VIRGFTIAMIWGIGVGTYSSIFVAGSILVYVKPGTGTNVAAAGFGGAERTKSKEDPAHDEALQRFAALPDPGDDADDEEDAEASGEAAAKGPRTRANRRASTAQERRNRRRRRRKR